MVNLSHLTIPFQRPLLRKLNLMHEEILCSTFFSGKNGDYAKIFLNKIFLSFSQVKSDDVAWKDLFSGSLLMTRVGSLEQKCKEGEPQGHLSL